jgi:CHAT domain-containing protein/tetratricopeptide (TPR) repeat protein
VLNEEGEEIAAGEGGEDPASPLLALIAEHEGVYRLDVVAHESPKIHGAYRILVRQLRPVAAGDDSRVEGARALTEGRRFLARGSPKAITRLNASLRAWRAVADHRGEAEALGEMGELERKRGNCQDALGWYQKAFDGARQGGWSDGTALILSNMGLCKLQLGSYDEAIQLYQGSLNAWRRIGGPHAQAFALEALGFAYLKNRDPKSALQVLREGLLFAETAGDFKRQARILSNIGSSQSEGGRPGEALQTFQKALSLSSSIEDWKTTKAIEYNLAAVYQKTGHLQKAVDRYTRQIASVQPADRGMQYYSLGSLYLDLGEPEKALKNYELSRQTFHRAGQRDDEVMALIGIGSAHQRLGEPQAALVFFEQARAVLPRPSRAVLHYLGLALDAVGKPAEARPLLEQALKIAQASHTPVDEAMTQLALGSVYRQLGKPDLAADRFSEAINLGSATESPSVVAPALLRRAMLRRDQGRLAEAQRDAEQALDIVESTRRNIAGQQLRLSFFANRRSFYEFYVDLLMQLDRLHPRKGYQELALWASERARARGLLDLLAEGKIDVIQGLDPDLRKREDQLSFELSQRQRALRASNVSPERVRELRAELDRLDEQRQQLDWEIRARDPRYAQVRYPTPLKLEEIQHRLLDGNTALLEFALGEKSSTLFVVTRQGMSSYPLPPAQVIADQVRRLRPALETESVRTQREYQESAFQLYRMLLAPASRVLAGRTDLLIVPDGALYYVPFEALLTEPPSDRSFRDLPYLLRRYSISYVPSASVLAGLREPRREPVPANRKQLAAFAPFAGPGGNAPTREALRNGARDMAGRVYDLLPASSREISTLASLYPGEALSFLGEQASEAMLTRNQAVATAHRLHLATHAEIDERHPESSALVLKPSDGSDGMLRVDEIFNLKLYCDLAVLSACRTALGKEVTGEGLLGLTRAFFYAGVPSLVVSLWNVVDGPTPALMLDFYKDLDQMHYKARALRSAKLSMIEQGIYSHPSYWAPFILIGEPR